MRRAGLFFTALCATVNQQCRQTIYVYHDGPSSITINVISSIEMKACVSASLSTAGVETTMRVDPKTALQTVAFHVSTASLPVSRVVAAAGMSALIASCC
jgi:hypothetical protein